MDDNTIIELYWARDEQALAQSELKYGKLCRSVAFRILRDLQDAEECVNDTWLRAWGAMPPERPNVLSAFFSRNNYCFLLVNRNKRQVFIPRKYCI